MIRRRFWASVWLFCCLLAKAESKVVDTDNSCITFAFPEDDLTAQRKIMPRLDSFLERNQDKGLQTLRDVLAAAGEDVDLDIKVGKNDPLEIALLKYLIFLHQDIRSLLEVKAPLLQHLKQMPMDCSGLLASGKTKSGVYKIYPSQSHSRSSGGILVFCDMETDGGGWTVFLSRAKVSNPVNFTRNWIDYKTGFGTPGEEYWLGNEHLHTLTSARDYILRLEATDEFGKGIWGEWNTFGVDSEDNLYELTAIDAHPNNNDDQSLSYHTGQKFSTFDRDNDSDKDFNCAEYRKGGWWYNNCYYINPTGVHDIKKDEGIQLQNWHRKNKAPIRFITHLQLKMRPKICSSTSFP